MLWDGLEPDVKWLTAAAPVGYSILTGLSRAYDWGV